MRRLVVWQICAKGSEQLVALFFRAVSVPFLPAFHLRLFHYCIYIVSFDPMVSLFPGTYINITLPSNSRSLRLFCFFQNFWQLFILYVLHGPTHLVLFVLLTSAVFVEQYHSWSCSEVLIRSIFLTWYSFSEFCPLAGNANSSYVLYRRYLCISSDSNSRYCSLNI
jgi:hypothetical protein